MNSRRKFIFQLATTVGVLAATSGKSLAADAPKLEESDPTASALGYKADTTKVDGAKYPQHKNDQVCSGCALYAGKAGDAQGPCNAFQGKIVSAKGWCMAYAKKA